MNRLIILLSLLTSAPASLFSQALSYPKFSKDPVPDDYFGTKISDPYRWLEDENSKETVNWVETQNKITFDYLSKIPFRDQIKNRLSEIWNFPKETAPFKKGKYYFTYKNNGVQNQSVLYIQERLNGPSRVIFDPNKESSDGTISMVDLGISNDVKYMAFALSQSGSDWSEIHVMNIETGERRKEEIIKWVKFSNISWHKNGFFYSRYEPPVEGKEFSKKNEFHKVYYHVLGTNLEKDKIIYENKEFPMRTFHTIVTEDEKFLIISESESTSGMELHCMDLNKPESKFIQIAPGFDFDYSVIDNIGDKLLIKTDYKASNYRLVEVDLRNPSRENWKDILPESKEVLEGVTISRDKIIAQYMKDASSRAYVFDLAGKKIRDIELPGIGYLTGFYASKDDDASFYSYTTYTAPATNYSYNIITGKSEVIFRPEIKFNSGDYLTKQIFYKSKDGTTIPMFITHKKDLKLDGSNPTFLYGYGGFNISKNPEFLPDRLVFLENGGVYAVANLRGGGEYGKEWHDAGTKLRKQNVFDDFIAAAEYLISEKYTSNDKLAIHGRSNGGLLIGAVMTQRPDLARVAIPTVGVLDMLKFHKFTIGWAWKEDYGSSEDPEQFKYLLGYSPLHNIKKDIKYPATLVITADHDDRVVPAHSFKFITTLQENQGGANPVLIRIDVKAGHGSGKPISKQIDEFSDIWAFVFHNLGIKPK